MPKYISLANLEKFYNIISDRPVNAFDTVADMQAATYLEPGVTCHTNGFNTSGDGGAAYYKVGTSGSIALYGGLRASEIATTNIVQDNSITTAKLADQSVTTDKLASTVRMTALTNAEIDVITEGGN